MQFQSPTGTLDIYAPESDEIQKLVVVFSKLVKYLGYKLILTPMFEDAGLFKAGAGQNADVVTKEMYEFEDKSGRHLALKPEGTASVIRAFVQHSYQTPFKAWYLSPAFRYENPQSGRYRQHHQLGVEVLGPTSYLADVEIIYLLDRFYKELGLKNYRLLINSMGHSEVGEASECRNQYKVVLLKYLDQRAELLCQDHRLKYELNPLRVLDCKKPDCVGALEGAPRLVDYLCQDCMTHHESVLNALSDLNIEFENAHNLVRGFDYYTKTTFEFQSTALKSSQSAISGGGRYDNLVANLGGQDVSGAGFGIGIERLMMALNAEEIRLDKSEQYDCFLVNLVTDFMPMKLIDSFIKAGLRIGYSIDGGSLKSQMRQANKSGADIGIIIGASELESASATLKNLRNSDQFGVSIDSLVSEASKLLATIREKKF